MDRSLDFGSRSMMPMENNNVSMSLKNQKISPLEQNFIKEYRHLEDLEREKGIKFFQCVGDAPITVETRQSIKEQRDRFIAEVREFMRDTDVRRFRHAFDSDRVIVETTVDLPEKPRWDSFENNHFAMRRRLVGIWLRATNLLITRTRAGKRLQKIKWKLKTENIRNRADCRRFVIEDWKNAQNMRISDSEHEDNIENIKFKFNFNSNFIGEGQMKLPLEYETNIAYFMEKVEANPPISFDDLMPFEHVEPLDFEQQKYVKFPLAQMSNFDPLEIDKIFRPGCEYESVLKQRRGEPELEKLQF